jgi:beta-lactamase regulating signal transducer with metallopeptidase domain/uncharacterized protein YnzC (UPF0291/DUF896 family)
MNIFQQLIGNPYLTLLGWAFIHFIWQGALVLLIYLVLNALLRSSSANLRYLLGCSTLLLMLGLPVATIWVIKTSPQWAESRRSFLQTGEAKLGTDTVLPLTAQENSSVPNLIQGASGEEARFPFYSYKGVFTSLLPWVVLVWAVGVLLLSLRFIGGLAFAQRLKRAEAGPLIQAWQERINLLSERLRISKPVQLCESVAVEVPAVIGWLRPIILVPASTLVGLNPNCLEALFAHELAHIKRYDYLVNLVQSAIEILLFYHPAVWWVSKQVRQEREHCCDDLAVSTCGNVTVYAHALVELEQLRITMPPLAVAANGGSLLRRIHRLISPSPPALFQVSSWKAGLSILLAGFVIAASAQSIVWSSYARIQVTGNSEPHQLVQLPSELPKNPLLPNDPTINRSMNDLSKTLPKTFSNELEGSSLFNSFPFVAHNKDADTQSEQNQAAPLPPAQDLRNELAALGVGNLSDDQINEMNALRITTDYIKEMKALLPQQLSVANLINLRTNGLTKEYIRDLQSLGYADLSVSELVSLRVNGISPTFIETLKNFGYNNLSASQLVTFKLQGIFPTYIQSMKELIGGPISATQLIDLKMQGVSAEFIQEMKAEGYPYLSADHLIHFRAHGVTVKFIKEMRASGYSTLSAEQLIALKVSNITPEFIESLKANGYGEVSVEKLIELRRTLNTSKRGTAN